MMGGMPTLAWSMVVFLLAIYLVSLVFRDSLGPDPSVTETMSGRNSIVERYFENVPRSMLTVFRCSFGDCSTDQGTPIFEHVTETYGWFWSFVYCTFLFIVVVGLCNVISAIFVQATLASGKMLAVRKRDARLEDETRWATNFMVILRSLLVSTNSDLLPDLESIMGGKCTDSMLEQILAMEFPRQVFDSVLQEDEFARRALRKLDIDAHDSRHLADLMDPDNNGRIGVLELVDGLRRLRGYPRRHDIVAVDLMVRSVQEKLDDVWRWMQDHDGVQPKAANVQSRWRATADAHPAEMHRAWSSERQF
jgi:hypothetical protein